MQNAFSREQLKQYLYAAQLEQAYTYAQQYDQVHAYADLCRDLLFHEHAISAYLECEAPIAALELSIRLQNQEQLVQILQKIKSPQLQAQATALFKKYREPEYAIALDIVHHHKLGVQELLGELPARVQSYVGWLYAQKGEYAPSPAIQDPPEIDEERLLDAYICAHHKQYIKAISHCQSIQESTQKDVEHILRHCFQMLQLHDVAQYIEPIESVAASNAKPIELDDNIIFILFPKSTHYQQALSDLFLFLQHVYPLQAKLLQQPTEAVWTTSFLKTNIDVTPECIQRYHRSAQGFDISTWQAIRTYQHARIPHSSDISISNDRKTIRVECHFQSLADILQQHITFSSLTLAAQLSQMTLELHRLGLCAGFITRENIYVLDVGISAVTYAGFADQFLLTDTSAPMDILAPSRALIPDVLIDGQQPTLQTDVFTIARLIHELPDTIFVEPKLADRCASLCLAWHPAYDEGQCHAFLLECAHASK